jgi:hypothetical protein
VARCSQVFGERAGYVGEPTGLGQRRHLRGEKANGRIHVGLRGAIMSLASASFICSSMQRFLIGLTLTLLLIVSIGIGIAVARWPEWRHFVF